MAAAPTPLSPTKAKWTYERGEGRTKHCWNHEKAGFRPSKQGAVGKCSNAITDKIAQELLNEGLSVPPEEGELQQHPDEIFGVYMGAVYVAVPTRPGVSYHGYPYKGRLTKRIYDELAVRAAKQGCEKEFQKWAKDYLTR